MSENAFILGMSTISSYGQQVVSLVSLQAKKKKENKTKKIIQQNVKMGNRPTISQKLKAFAYNKLSVTKLMNSLSTLGKKRKKKCWFSIACSLGVIKTTDCVVRGKTVHRYVLS